MKLNGDRNQCPACKEPFNSSFAFDKHRVGSFGPHQRRCLTVDEMTSKGMSRNSSGFWISQAHPNTLSEPDVMPKWPFV